MSINKTGRSPLGSLLGLSSAGGLSPNSLTRVSLSSSSCFCSAESLPSSDRVVFQCGTSSSWTGETPLNGSSLLQDGKLSMLTCTPSSTPGMNIVYIELLLDSCAVPLVSEQQHTSIEELLWFSFPYTLFVSLGKEQRAQRSELCDCVFRGGVVGNGLCVFVGTLKERIRDDLTFSAIHRGRRSFEESRVRSGTFKLFLEFSFVLEFGGLEACG